LWKFLDETAQNTETGYWGAWYQWDGGIYKTDDLSITFHVAKYRKGKVPRLSKIANTTLSIKNKNYPFGWLENGEMTNHHNMDVVTLLNYGWPSFTDSIRQAASGEIEKMLRWSLKHSLQPDGGFLMNESDDSLVDATYFGSAFLKSIGFFDKKAPFWRDKPFKNVTKICKRILKKVKTLSQNELMVKDSLELLKGCIEKISTKNRGT